MTHYDLGIIIAISFKISTKKYLYLISVTHTHVTVNLKVFIKSDLTDVLKNPKHFKV